jgi:hypothetical protein
MLLVSLSQADDRLISCNKISMCSFMPAGGDMGRFGALAGYVFVSDRMICMHGVSEDMALTCYEY